MRIIAYDTCEFVLGSRRVRDVRLCSAATAQRQLPSGLFGYTILNRIELDRAKGRLWQLETIMQRMGYDCYQYFMIDLTDAGKSGRQVQEELEALNIIVNKNKIQGDKRSAVETSGIRIGTPFISNFKKVDKHAFDELASIIAAVVHGRDVPPMKILAKIFK